MTQQHGTDKGGDRRSQVDDSTAWDRQGEISPVKLMTQQHGTDKCGDQPSQVDDSTAWDRQMWRSAQSS